MRGTPMSAPGERVAEAVKTDLGIIRVESVGHRDLVTLAHNNVRAFTLTCVPGKESRVRISKQFKLYDIHQFSEVFTAYFTWKRSVMQDFKLPNFSGRTTDGREHPWRRRLRKL